MTTRRELFAMTTAAAIVPKALLPVDEPLQFVMYVWPSRGRELLKPAEIFDGVKHLRRRALTLLNESYRCGELGQVDA